jgi:predicted Zn-dependent peptidase
MNRILILLTLFISSFSLNAQKYTLVTDTVKGRVFKEVKGDPMNTRIYTLKNGLTVMLSLNRDAPRIYTCIGTRAGSKNDPKDATGLAHYLEHMLFKGTDKYGSLDYGKEQYYLNQIDTLYTKYGKTKNEEKRKFVYRQIDSISGLAAKYAIANEYDKMVQNIGAKGTNAYTSFDETVYINDIPSNRVGDWIKIEAERFRNPILRLFHTELEAVYEEKNISLDSDDSKVYEALFSNLFKHHTYGTQTTIGTIEHLKNPSLQKIREFYSNWYVPNNMVISMAGAFDYDDVIEMIDASFGKFPSKEIPKFTFFPEKPNPAGTETTVYGPESEYVVIAYRLPAPGKEESAIMRVSEMLLSNSKSGLFDINLKKKQLVLDASAGIYQLRDYSILFLEGRPKTGQSLEELKKLMLAQIDSLQRGKFTQADMDAIILNSKVNTTNELESNPSRAFKMVNSFIQETPWNEVVEETDLMGRVTREDIMKFTKKWLKTDFTVVYKRIGIDSTVVKIDKPQITPVEVNRNSMSHFTKDILDNEAKPISPVFIDFKKDFQTTVINKDVDFLSIKNKKNNLFKLYYVFEFGRYSNQKLPFAIQLLEFLGTNKLSPEALSRQFFALGCEFNVYAGAEQTYVTLSGPQEKFERALSTLEHLMANAIPNQDALDALIADELQDREDAKTNKYAVRNALGAYARYGKKNPQNWIIPSKKLKKLKAKELTEMMAELSSYPHTVMYYGPSETVDILKLVNKYHKLPEAMKSAPKTIEFKPLAATSRKVYFTNYDMVQAEIGWLRNEGQYQPERQPIISLFNEYFGGGMSSIVFQTIRESKALAYSSYAFYSSPIDKNKNYLAGAYIGTQSDKLDSAIFAMDELLTKMPESEILFSGAKASLIAQIQSERILKEDIFFKYLSARRLGLTEDSRKEVYEKIPTYTLTDVASFHKEYISGKPFDIYIVASKDRVPMSKLKKYGTVKEVSLKEIFGY